MPSHLESKRKSRSHQTSQIKQSSFQKAPMKNLITVESTTFLCSESFHIYNSNGLTVDRRHSCTMAHENCPLEPHLLIKIQNNSPSWSQAHHLDTAWSSL